MMILQFYVVVILLWITLILCQSCWPAQNILIDIADVLFFVIT